MSDAKPVKGVLDDITRLALSNSDIGAALAPVFVDLDQALANAAAVVVNLQKASADAKIALHRYGIDLPTPAPKPQGK